MLWIRTIFNRKTIPALILQLIMLSAMQQHCSAQTSSRFKQAESLYNQKKFSEAQAAFRQAQSMGEKPAESAYYEALCFHQLRKMNEARAAYLRVVNTYPRSSVAPQALKVLTQMDPRLAAIVEAKKQEAKNAHYSKTYGSLPNEALIYFQKSPGGGHMLVNASFNGTELKVIFDTGAGGTSCKQSALDRLGIKPRWTGQTGTSLGVGGEIPVKVGIITVKAGNLTRELPVRVQQDPGGGNRPDFLDMPLLGQDFLDGYSYEIDDSQGVVKFTKNQATAQISKQSNSYRDPNEVPFTRMGSHIIVKPKVNGRECEMILDTGAGAVAFSDKHLAMCGLNRPTSAVSAMSAGVGGTREGYNFTVDRMELGPVIRTNVKASIMLHADVPMPLLGQSFLHGLKYEIDSARNVIRFHNQ